MGFFTFIYSSKSYLFNIYCVFIVFMWKTIITFTVHKITINLKIIKMYTKTQIIKGLNSIVGFEKAEFYVTDNGDLTMSLDGMFVDHKWKVGTFLNK